MSISISLDSYINNICPSVYRDFCSILKNLIDEIIPMFEQTLIEFKAPGRSNHRFHLAVKGCVPLTVNELGEFLSPEL